MRNPFNEADQLIGFERAGVRIGLHLQGREANPEPLFQLFAEINQE